MAFCLYIGEHGELRAYIPKDGNVYNFKTKAAIGNWDQEDDESDSESDESDCEDDDVFDDEDDELYPFIAEVKHFGLPREFNMDKLRADAANRITFKKRG